MYKSGKMLTKPTTLKSLVKTLLVSLPLLFFSFSVSGTDYVFNGNNSSAYNDPGNWSPFFPQPQIFNDNNHKITIAASCNISGVGGISWNAELIINAGKTLTYSGPQFIVKKNGQ